MCIYFALVCRVITPIKIACLACPFLESSPSCCTCCWFYSPATFWLLHQVLKYSFVPISHFDSNIQFINKLFNSASYYLVLTISFETWKLRILFWILSDWFGINLVLTVCFSLLSLLRVWHAVTLISGPVRFHAWLYRLLPTQTMYI